MTTPIRGGTRPGSGRHSLYGRPMFKCTFRVPLEHIDILSQIDPNLSASLRVIMDDPRTAKAIKKLIKEREGRVNTINENNPLV